MMGLKPISLAEACKAGLVRYFTGHPCKYGHVAERFVSTRHCVACAVSRATQWKRDNPQKHAAQKVDWIRKNPDRYRAIKAAWSRAHPEWQARRARKWFLSNREKANSATQAWAMKNPGKRNARAAQRRADWILRTPQWSDLKKISAIYEEARSMREFGEVVEVDHVIPLKGKKVSGLHVHENLQIIPALENRAKYNHFLEI